jgi:uncharacterized protein YeeX (DUF496 family)
MIVSREPAKAMRKVSSNRRVVSILTLPNLSVYRSKTMTVKNEIKTDKKISEDILDNKDRYVIQDGHVRVKTDQLLQSPKVKKQIEKIREIFQ